MTSLALIKSGKHEKHGASERRPIAVDIFSGGGGMSRGFAMAGYDVALAIEADKWAAETYRINHPQAEVLNEDVRNVSGLDCLKILGLRPGQVSVVFGGPPCQGFSESNRRSRDTKNPSNYLFREMLRIGKVLRPEWIVIENVVGLRTIEGGFFLDLIVKELRAIGYPGISLHDLNSAEHGVPQTRRRLFIIAHSLGHIVDRPAPTHGPGLLPVVTVRNAISDLPKIANGTMSDDLKYATSPKCSYQALLRDNGTSTGDHFVTRNAKHIVKRYAHIPPGGNWESIPKRLLGNYSDSSRCHTGIYHRLEWNAPAKVVSNFRKNMIVHPDQDRGLSVREAARLQSFPDSHRFLGSIGFRQQQVADAVPPILANVIASAVRESSSIPMRSLKIVG